MRNKPECPKDKHVWEEHGDEDTMVCVICGLLIKRRCEWVKSGFIELDEMEDEEPWEDE